MRLVSAIAFSILTAAPVLAQQAARPADTPPLQLPVSLDRIRAALERSPVQRLKITDRKPDFRVEIQERQRIDSIMSTLDFKSGPVAPGGLYGFEQRARLSRSPWSGQPIGIDLLPIARSIAGAIDRASRAAAIAAAHKEVNVAIAEWCDAQPDHGAGIYICKSPDIR